MNKKELVASVAALSNLTQKQAEAAIEAVTIALKDTLCTGESTTIPGLGTFSVKLRAARNGRNPKTGETIIIAEAKVAEFKPAKALKDAVAQGQLYFLGDR